MKKTNLFLILLFPVLIIVARLSPHLPNFIPVVAVALSVGVYVGKKWAIILPIAALLISDFFVGFYELPVMLAVYGSFVLIGIFSWWLRKNKTVLNVFSIVLLSSISFFIITNLAVWFFSAWYTKDLSGLIYCFQMAIPFFRYSLAGNLFYATILFGSFELAKMLIKEKQLKTI